MPWVPGPERPGSRRVRRRDRIDPIEAQDSTYEFTADLRLTDDPLLAIRAITAAAAPVDLARRSPRALRPGPSLGGASAARIRPSTGALRPPSKPVIDPRWLAYQIAQLCDDNSLVIDDTTHDRIFPYLRLSRPGSYFHNPGSAGGWAPGAALGAKLAAPERDVIAVTGDGFYMYGAPTSAIWAAARHGAPFLTVIFQNRSYTTGTVAVANSYPDGYAQRSGFDGGYLEPAMDFAKEAEAAGAYGENVRDPREVGAALRRGLERTRAGQPRGDLRAGCRALLQED